MLFGKLSPVSTISLDWGSCIPSVLTREPVLPGSSLPKAKWLGIPVAVDANIPDLREHLPLGQLGFGDKLASLNLPVWSAPRT